MAIVLTGCVVGSFFAPAKPPVLQPAVQPITATLAPQTTLFGVPERGVKPRFAHLPSTSCAAASCHGSGQIGKLGSEYSAWAPEVTPPDGAYDPHSKAYSVLFNADAARIGKYLDIVPHKSELCLKCHAVDGAKDEEAQNQMRAEGAGCGACHGPAEKWISVHFTPEFLALPDREKWEKYGFVPTKNLVARTMNCVSCHVGDVDRDMNHDMIAAGHPRLAFESARFHYNPQYRKHWTERGSETDFEVRAWVVGQVATLRNAAVLLQARAKRAADGDAKTPWPEFSGLSCYACHQQIGDKELRGGASASTRPLGVPGWEVWSNTAVRVAADYCGEVYPGLSSLQATDMKLTNVNKLRAMMEKRPSAKDIESQAKLAVEELDAWLVALQTAGDSKPPSIARDTPRKIAHALASNALTPDGTKLADHDWDALAANYLGCAAMYHATGGAAGNSWGKELKDLHGTLQFPPPGKGAWADSPILTRNKLNQITT